MLIPTDQPFLGVPDIKHQVEKRPVAWIYPWSPTVVLDFQEKEQDEFDKNRFNFLLTHELAHTLQMRNILPLNLILWHVISSSFNSPILYKFEKDEFEAIDSIITAYTPFLEGFALLGYLTSEIDDAFCKYILREIGRSQNDIVIEGLHVLLGIEDSHFNWERTYNFIKKNKAEIRNFMHQLHLILNVTAFFKIPINNLEKDWEYLCYKIALDSLQNIFKFIIYPNRSQDRERIWNKVIKLRGQVDSQWKKLFKGILKSMEKKIKDEAVLNLLYQLNPYAKLGMYIPLILPNGVIKIVKISDDGKIRFVKREESNWIFGADWIFHLISMELIKSLSERKRNMSCPLFKMTAGQSVAPFCGEAKPSLEFCTFLGVQKKGQQIDVTFRGKSCFYWKLIEFKFLRQFSELWKKTGYKLFGNKIVYDGSGKFSILSTPIDSDLSVKQPISENELKQFIEELPEHYLNMKVKQQLIEGLQSGVYRQPLLFNEDGIKMAESKTEFLLSLLRQLENFKIGQDKFIIF